VFVDLDKAGQIEHWDNRRTWFGVIKLLKQELHCLSMPSARSSMACRQRLFGKILVSARE